jgi:hypothetical protein
MRTVIGGVVSTLIIDNLRAAVQKAAWFEPELNPKVVSFCEHYGTVAEGAVGRKINARFAPRADDGEIVIRRAQRSPLSFVPPARAHLETRGADPVPRTGDNTSILFLVVRSHAGVRKHG